MRLMVKVLTIFDCKGNEKNAKYKINLDLFHGHQEKRGISGCYFTEYDNYDK
jgi:hypothetical protein